MKKILLISFLFFVFFLSLFSSCQFDSSSEKKSSLSHSLSQIFSLHHWRVKNEVKVLIEEAKQESAHGNHAMALGKFRRAYRLVPQKNFLPLEISKQYAWIAYKDSSLTYEKAKALDWLMNSYRANYELTLQEISAPPLSVLAGMSLYESLKERLKSPGKQDRNDSQMFPLISQGLNQLAKSLVEDLKIKGENGYIVNFMKDNETWHRVRLGSFSSITEAQDYAVTLKDQNIIEDYFITR